MKRIAKLIKDKRIAIIGNASSMLYYKHDIDSYDVIIRINLGYPIEDLKEQLGTRTDIWMICGGFSSRCNTLEGYKKLNPLYTVSIDRNEELDTIIPNYIRYPQPLIEQLRAIIYKPGEYPHASTGLNALNMCINIGGFKDITLFGFDFFRTHDWTNVKPIHRVDTAHDFIKEEYYFMELLKNVPNLNIVYKGKKYDGEYLIDNKEFFENINKCECGYINKHLKGKCWKCQRVLNG